jgi:hypothetical protein
MERMSKLDAAKRVFAEAIRLFFERRDEVAVHSLAAAAHGILLDIARKRKLKFNGILHEHPSLRPELKSAWRNMLNAPRNFFKHADKDPDGQLYFDGVLNEILLLYTVALAAMILDDYPPEVFVFAAWYEMAYPDFSGAFPKNWALAQSIQLGLIVTDRETFAALYKSNNAVQ